MIPPPIYKTGAELLDRYWWPAVTVLADIAQRGVWVDRGRAEEVTGLIEDELARLQGAWDRLAPGVEWTSPQQVNALLYDRLGLPVPPVEGSRGTPGLNTRGDRNAAYWALRWIELNRPEHATLATTLRRLKILARTRTNYIGALLDAAQVDGRARPRLTQRAATGRVTCSGVPLQQFTRAVGDPLTDAPRGCVAAPPGRRLIGIDLPSAEWRGLAQYAIWLVDDRTLLDEILRGIDPHNATAVGMFGLDAALAAPGVSGDALKVAGHKAERNVAKIFNYSLIYGKGEHGYRGALTEVSALAEPASAATTADYMRRMREGRPSIFATIDAAVEFARAHGGVRTITGRWRQLPAVRERCARHGWRKPEGYCAPCVRRAAAERQTLNSMIQGFVADLANYARLLLNTTPHPELVARGWYHPELAALGWAQVLEVHDELIFEGPEDTAEEAATIIAGVVDGLGEFLRGLGLPWEPPVGPAEAAIGGSWLESK